MHTCLLICDLAGVMYWGDSFHKIEKANLNGTGRTVLLRENSRADYFAFQFHGGNIYFTDWYKTYVHLFTTLQTVTSMDVPYYFLVAKLKPCFCIFSILSTPRDGKVKSRPCPSGAQAHLPFKAIEPVGG